MSGQVIGSLGDLPLIKVSVFLIRYFYFNVRNIKNKEVLPFITLWQTLTPVGTESPVSHKISTPEGYEIILVGLESWSLHQCDRLRSDPTQENIFGESQGDD